MRDVIPSLILAIFVIAILLVWELRPPSSGTVIAVLGPNTTLRETVSETEAYLVNESRLPNGFVLYSRAPDFPQRLRDAGAIFVIKSDYAGTCYQPSANEQTNTGSPWPQVNKGSPNDQIS